MNELLTPEVMGSLKTLAGFAGLDILTGAVNNKLIGRTSLILKGVQTGLNALSVLSSGLADLIKRVQDYGDEPISK